MGSEKSELIIANPSTHGKDARKGLMNQENIILAFLTDSSKTPDTVRKSWGWTEAKCKEMK